jgi:hypothetical protein
MPTGEKPLAMSRDGRLHSIKHQTKQHGLSNVKITKTPRLKDRA